MRKGTVLTALALLAGLVPVVAQAQTQKVLLFDSGPARALGMGNAFTPVADDLSAVLWNPAGLARVTTKQVSYSDAFGSSPMGMRFAGYVQPGQDSPAGALSYLQANNSAYGMKQQSLAYSFAQDIGSRLAVGLNIKYSRFERGDSGKESFSVDGGALYNVADNITLGVGILNPTEPDMPGTVTPAKAARLVNAGLAFRLHEYSEPGQLGTGPKRYATTVSVELFDTTDEVNRQLRFGVEHRLSQRYTARVGLLSDTPTVGLGVHLGGYTVDGGVVIGRSGRRSTESMLSISSGF